MNDYEACLKEFNDPKTCRFVSTVFRLAEALRLDKCIDRGRPQRCLNKCLKNCRGEDCRELCLNAMDVAAARSIARRLVRSAVDAASETGLTVPEAVAVGFRMMLDEHSDDCVAKVISMRTLGLVAIELRSLLGMRKMLLLLAPTIASAYECIGDDAFGLLDMITPTIGQKTAKRIAKALEKGVVKIGRIEVEFSPVKPA